MKDVFIFLIVVSVFCRGVFAGSVALQFDEKGKYTFTDPNGNKVNLQATTSSPTGWDGFGSTLTYALPSGYSYATPDPNNPSDTAWAVIVTDNATTVSDLLVFNGSGKVFIYDSPAAAALESGQADLVAAYNQPANLNGPIPLRQGETLSSVSYLQYALPLQNPSQFIASHVLTVSEAPVTGGSGWSQSFLAASGGVGIVNDTLHSYDTTFTFVSQVPTPSVASVAVVCLAALVCRRGLSTGLRRHAFRAH